MCHSETSCSISSAITTSRGDRSPMSVAYDWICTSGEVRIWMEFRAHSEGLGLPRKGRGWVLFRADAQLLSSTIFTKWIISCTEGGQMLRSKSVWNSLNYADSLRALQEAQHTPRPH